MAFKAQKFTVATADFYRTLQNSMSDPQLSPNNLRIGIVSLPANRPTPPVNCPRRASDSSCNSSDKSSESSDSSCILSDLSTSSDSGSLAFDPLIP